jgi:Ca2+/Na+ antiporter
MHQIIDGYAKYHAVLAIVGGVFLLTLLVLSVKSWIKFRRVAKTGKFKWSFEKKVYFCFATLYAFVALFLALITAANVTNATNPLPGFTGGISSMTTDSYNKQLYAAFNDWIVSGNTTAPNLVQQRIQHRRVFHTTRTVVGIVLLAVFTVLSISFWKTLVKKRKTSEAKWTLKETGMLLAGMAAVALALVMMIVVMANLQSAIAPIANTLQFG